MSNTPLKILYLIDFWASPGGTERHLSYLITHLDTARFHCHVVVFNFQPNALADAARAKGIEIIHLPVARYYTPGALLKAFTLARIIRERKIDVVQTFHYKSDIYGAVVARLAGVRHIVASKRDAADYKSAFRFFMHKIVRPITRRYIAVSEVVAEVIRRKEGVDGSRISVIHNGVDLARYQVPDAVAKAAAKARFGFEPDSYVIGMSAWFRPEKDHQLLFDAFTDVLARTPAARLLFAGNGPLFEHYREWVKQQPFADKVRFAGAVDDVRPVLHALDVACLVPRMNEGFSNSVIEKMASGLPVVVTDIGGNREAVANAVNGYVIAPGDRQALAGHLQRLHDDAVLHQRMSRASRARVEELFSLDSMIDRHAALYTALARDGGSPA